MQRQARSLSERVGNDYRWLVPQVLILGVLTTGAPAGRRIAGRLPAPWPSGIDVLVGAALMAFGFVVANQARRDLGDSLRVAPTPLDDAKLVECGWYGRVRHPLYFAVLLASTGWVVAWMSAPGIVFLMIVAVFLQRKSRHEETLLMATYPNYAAYARRVRSRFVPGAW